MSKLDDLKAENQRLRAEVESLRVTQAEYFGGYVIYGDEKWWNAGVVNRERDDALKQIAELEAKLKKQDENHKEILKQWMHDHNSMMTVADRRILDIEEERDRLIKEADYWKERSHENRNELMKMNGKLSIIEGILREKKGP